MNQYRCLVCGYIHEGDQPPESCPVCGVPSSEFERIEPPKAEAAGKATAWKCLVCGYIHEGDQPPESCPVCGVPSSEFERTEPPKAETTGKAKAWKCMACGYVHNGDNPPENCPVCGMPGNMFNPEDDEGDAQTGDQPLRIVIVGSGIAGVSCAEEIRNNSEKAEITLISAENSLPYYRISLTRYLASDVRKENLVIHPLSFYQEKRINLLTGVEVTDIDADNKRVELSDGTSMPYDRLILASGATPNIPPIPGSNLRNVMTVRDVEDVNLLLDLIRKTESCVCIGGGLLGLETAGAIAKHGVRVTVLEVQKWLMPRQLNQKAASILKSYLDSIGIVVRENVAIQEIVGDEACEGVKLNTGEVLPAQLVIITAGIRPNVLPAQKAGLKVNKGIVVDSRMQTSQKDIFAAGDVAEYDGMLYGLWNAAQYQGKIAARNVIGEDARFGGMPPSATLKVLGLDIFSIGDFTPNTGDSTLYEQEATGRYVLFAMKEDKMIGSIIIGDKALAAKVKQAVEKGLVFPQDSAEKIIEKLKT